MTDQIDPPQRSKKARYTASPEKRAQDKWKAQFGRLLDEYRNQYVLRPSQHTDEKPAP